MLFLVFFHYNGDMNNAPELILELIEAYDKKLQELDRFLLPAIKDNFLLFQAVFRSFYELLLQKGVMKPDPYKNERHLSDIYIPEILLLTDNEIEEQLPIKIAEYDNLLDFLNNYTQFKSASMGLKRIKIVSSIVRYVEWGKLTPANPQSITKGLANIVEKARNGNEAMVTASIQSSHNKLDQTSKEIMRQLKALADFKREEYKLFIRQRIVQHFPVFHTDINKEEFLKQVKNQFTRAMEGEAFFPELIQELYEEIYLADPESTKHNLLEKLKPDEQKKKKSESHQALNLRDILMEGVRHLGGSSRHLDDALIRLKESQEILQSRPRTFMEKFKLWIVSLSQGKQKDEIFEVELVDPHTTMKRLVKINFTTYSQELSRRAKFFTSLMVRTSANYVKLETSPEDQIYSMLEKNLAELKGFHDHLDAVDTYFKSEAPGLERSKMHGIKVELSNIKNSIALVNQKMHEYVARKDEKDQLKKLGIGTDE